MKLRIKIGGFGEPVQVLEVTHFEVLSEGDDTRAMFYVYPGKDGVSLEVSAGGTFKAGGKVYDSRFAIHPIAGNAVTLRPVEYRA